MALLALSGARIDVTTALRWGLVDEVHEGIDGPGGLDGL
jgi:enoyl-CoA hydratase/carnithine racemase